MKKNSLAIFLIFILILNLFTTNLSHVFALAEEASQKKPQLLVDSQHLEITAEEAAETSTLQLQINKKSESPTRLDIDLTAGEMVELPEDRMVEKKPGIFQETSFTTTPEQIVTLKADAEGKLTFSLGLFSEDRHPDTINLLTKEESGPHHFDFQKDTSSSEDHREEPVYSDTMASTTESTTKASDTQSSEGSTEAVTTATTESTTERRTAAPQKTQALFQNTLALIKDPFLYTKNEAGDEQGMIPTLATSEHLGPGDHQNKTIKNFDYGSRTPENGSDPVIKSSKIDALPINFDNGYHQYQIDMGEQHGLAETKQTIRPTDQEDVFEVTLDTIGDALKVEDKLDVVFVIDASSSMVASGGVYYPEEERGWTRMKAAIEGFCNELVKEPSDGGEPRVRVGLTAFGSTHNNNKFRPYGDIATFNGSGKTPQYFTSNAKDILGHRILAKEPISSGSGTPTFLGVDAGLTVLHEQGRTEAKKVLITITDGPAAFAPTTKYYEKSLSQQELPSFKYSLKNGPLPRFYTQEGTTTVTETTPGVKTLRFLIDDLSLWTDSSKTEAGQTLTPNDMNIKLIKERYREVSTTEALGKIDPFLSYGVAFKAEKTHAVPTREITLTLADNNEKRAVVTDDSAEFIMLLSNFFSSYRDTIFGKLVAPLSDAVEYLPGSAEISALLLNTFDWQLTVLTKTDRGPSLPAFASYAEVSEPTPEKNQFTIDRLHLGIEPKLSRTGIGESNKTGNGETIPHDPDIRQGYRLSYRVKLKESHQDGIYHQVAQETYLENTIDIHRGEKISGAPRLYYAIPSARSSSRTRFTKMIAGTTTELAGVTFGLYPRDGDKEPDKNAEPMKRSNVSDSTGLVEFENVVAGDYWLVEIEQPDLYHPSEPIKVTVDDVGKLNKVTASGPQSLSKVENHLKDLVLKINKTDQVGESMKEVIFTLEGEGQKIPFTATSEGGYLSDPITPGTYLLKEQLPKGLYPGYQQEKPLAELVFSKTGEISYDDLTSEAATETLIPTKTTGGSDGKTEQLMITRNIQNKLQPFDLAITKIGQDGAANFLPGAEFTLYNEDGSQELGKETSDSKGKLTFTGLITAGNSYRLQETKPPEGHQLLETYFTLSVSDAGEASLTYNGKSMPITLTLSDGGKNNQLAATISNRRNFALPDAGAKPELSPLRWLAYALILLAFLVGILRPKQRN